MVRLGNTLIKAHSLALLQKVRRLHMMAAMYGPSLSKVPGGAEKLQKVQGLFKETDAKVRSRITGMYDV